MPVINNVAVASGTGLSTAGNGGRKLVRLANGWMVSGVKDIANEKIHFYSTENSGAPTYLGYVFCKGDFALASKGTRVFGVYHGTPFTYVNGFSFEALDFNGANILQSSSSYSTNALDNQSTLGSMSIAINDAGTELHAAWASKNATYPNSFNIRYAKGIINPDGSVTWGAVNQVTTANSNLFGNSFSSLSLIVRKDGTPFITTYFENGTSVNDIRGYAFNGTSWSSPIIIYQLNGYQQFNPSSLFVPPVINGLANGRLWVAWHGKDATDSAKFNIRASYSDDGGSTWATPVKLTSGNTYDRLNVSLSADKTGKVFALYEDHQWAPDIGIRMKTYNGSWGAETSVATADTAEQHPSALVDFTIQMTTPPFVYTDTTLGIRFTGNFNVGASISPASGALGNKETTALTAYTVTPEAGSTVTQIVERINGTIVNTFNNPASLSRTLTAPNATWDTLAYFASHTASVTVTDSNGAQTVTTYSFDKALGTNASLLEAAKANTDAKNRISAKRDMLASQVGLSAGSTFDAISAQLASNAFKKSMTGTMTLTPTTITISGLAFKPEVVYYSRKDTQSPAIFGSVFKSPSFGTGIHMMHSTSGTTQVSTTGVVFGDTSVSFPNSIGSASTVDYVVIGK